MNQQRDHVWRPAKVLCIDDDPHVITCIELRLRGYCVNVLQALHGMHGLWLAVNEQPDVIITDINMPQGQGDYIVECLKANPETQDIPVIVLSGDRTEKQKMQMLNLGVAAYLTKPCDPERLLQEVENSVELRPIPDHVTHRSGELTSLPHFLHRVQL